MGRKRKKRGRRKIIRNMAKGQTDRGVKVYDPAYKAQATRGQTICGRITLSQYLFLVDLGEDGDKIKHWTRHRASQRIGQLKARREAAHA